MSRQIRIKLEEEEKSVAQWVLPIVDGYLENLQDDQDCCMQCGNESYFHQLDSEFDPARVKKEDLETMIVLDHEVDRHFPDFTATIEMDGETGDWFFVVALDPHMVMEYLTGTILDYDFQNTIDVEDYFKDFGEYPPAPGVALNLRDKLIKASEEVHS